MLSFALLPLAVFLSSNGVPAADGHETHTGHAMGSGMLGVYPMSRDASGTSWQPDATRHVMGHAMHGDWMLSGHLMLNGVYDRQQGPRGDEKSFVSGMVMGTARRNAANGGALTLRAMLSPDPLMGPSGYPLLLAAGETADGRTQLVDRQHPHDLFMELSATFAHPVGRSGSAFLYAGLPGEPAFGPPAFMHRPAALTSPEAPITHHWLDSTHISFGVVTAGWVQDDWKFEISQFTGREPDEDRDDIERPRMDSTAFRASWNPGEHWSLQASWANVESPEQLEPALGEARLSASVLYGTESWSATLAWGLKNPSDGESTEAVAFEAAYAPARDWQFFARAEWLETPELGADPHDIHEVAKVSVGVRREFAVSARVRLALGALYSLDDVDRGLGPSYGKNPGGAMFFTQFIAGT